MSPLCQDIKTSYEQLQIHTNLFKLKFAEVRDTGDLSEMRELRKKLEEARDAFFEKLVFFIVPEAKNPYHEALLEAGLDESKTQQKKEITLDLRKEVQRQLAIYREVQGKDGSLLLGDWVRDITENEGLLFAAVTKDRAKIEERIKAGMIPVVMPGRSVQEKTWEVAMTKLKPVWIERGIKKTVGDGRFHENYRAKMTQEGFFKDISDRPYLAWVHSNLESDPDTCDRSYPDQQLYYEKTIVRNKPNLYDSKDIIPTEFSALQAVFPANVREQFKEIEGGAREPATILPFDCGAFYTNLLSAGEFSADFIPFACFDPSSSRVYFGNGGLAADIATGFRPVSRP